MKIFAADLFCGGGGTSTGLAKACAESGRGLDLVAVNHWELAIETHRRNHPNARHVCSSLDGLNPRDLVPGGRLNILVASPECTMHSVARGGRPINDQSRASAWLVLKWLQELYVENVLIENVPEFENWGPLGANGKPMISKKGELFRQFIATLRSLGYAVDWKILNAANYGDPTTRRRLFVMARRGKNKEIVWPAHTHAQIKTAPSLFETLKPWKPARDIIDWDAPSQSIFKRKRPLAPNTLKRIYAGMQKFKWPEPFLVILRQHMSARSLDEPLPTLTAGGTHVGLCEPFVLGQQSGSVARLTSDPVPTVSTGGAISLIEPFMIAAGGPEGKGRNPDSLDAPMPPVLTENHTGLVTPFIVPNFGERDGQPPRTHSVDEPLPTVTGHGAGAVVEAFTIPMNHLADRLRSVDEPLQTITATSSDIGIVEPFIATVSHGEGDARRCKSVDEPLPTLTCSNDHGIVEPIVVRFDHQGSNAGRARSISEPLPTITTKNGLGIVGAFIVPQFSGASAKPVSDPLGVVTTTSRGIGLAEPFISKFYGTGVSVPVDEPLDTVTAKDRFGLCQVGDRLYDIHFRMLQPRELARAQGFPDDYEFAGGKAAATKLIGNAVPVNTAQALCTELLRRSA